MFDPTCKFLAENFPADFATWLLGEPIALTKLSPTELSLEPIRADSLILLSSAEIIVHLEFQTEPDPLMAFRMADYYLRIFRRYPNKRIIQIVIYLTPTKSDLVHQTVFETEVMRHQFQVIRLWEQPTAPFLESTGLLPLAVLTQTPDKAQTLRQVAVKIQAIPEKRIQSNIAASAGILAGLKLERDFINQVLRKDIMQQSVIYQEWIEEGRAEGRAEGREEGRLDGERSLVLRQLTRRIGNVTPALTVKVQTLSLPQLEALGEALLDFSQPADLVTWLDEN
jgi:predicted transposase/invertase (TIGR01784 family)